MNFVNIIMAALCAVFGLRDFGTRPTVSGERSMRTHGSTTASRVRAPFSSGMRYVNTQWNILSSRDSGVSICNAAPGSVGSSANLAQDQDTVVHRLAAFVSALRATVREETHRRIALTKQSTIYTTVNINALSAADIVRRGCNHVLRKYSPDNFHIQLVIIYKYE